MSDPITTTTAILTSFIHLTNLVKSGFETRDAVSLQEQKIAMLAEIAAIQSNQIAMTEKNQSLLEDNDKLRKEIARFEDWDRQMTRYKLHSPWGNAVVYSLIESRSTGEPPHWLCAQCYEKHKRSFLYPRHVTSHLQYYCSECGNIVPSQIKGNHIIKYWPAESAKA